MTYKILTIATVANCAVEVHSEEDAASPEQAFELAHDFVLKDLFQLDNVNIEQQFLEEHDERP
jgi:hypothetical protein